MPTAAPTRRPRWAVAVLVVYLALMALAVGWPDGWAVNRGIVGFYFTLVGAGVPMPFSPDVFAAVLNVLACIPPVAAAVALFPRIPWWAWVVAGVLLSVSVEVTQRFIGRMADPMDVVANGTGALLGGLLGRWLGGCRRPLT